MKRRDFLRGAGGITASLMGCVGLRKAAAVAPEGKVKKDWHCFELPTEAAAINPGDLKDCVPEGWAEEGSRVLAEKVPNRALNKLNFPEAMEALNFSEELDKYLGFNPVVNGVEVFQGKDWGSYRGKNCAWDQAYMCFIVADSETGLNFQDVMDLHITPALRGLASMFNSGEIASVGECGETPPPYVARGSISKGGRVPLRMVMQYSLEHQGYKVILDTYVLPTETS